MKYIYNILLILLLFVSNACEDYLDVQPTGKVIPRSVKEFRALLTNAYNNYAFKDQLGLITLRSDELSLKNENKNDVDLYLDLFIWNDNSVNVATRSYAWKEYYEVIFNANYLLENYIDIANGKEAEINQLVGEAYLLRAYSHFILVNSYSKHYNKETASLDAGIPLSLTTNTEVVLEKSSVQEVYNSILKDISLAKEKLQVKQWDDIYSYRFSRLSALAFESRVYLYMSDWQRVVDVSKELLEQKNTLSDLVSNYDDIPSLYNSVESIQALDYVIGENLYAATEVSNTVVNLYHDKDRRFKAFLTEGKLNEFSIDKGRTKAFRCTFRVGEVYMNLIEAQAHLGEADAAKENLFTLLQKRLVSDYFEEEKTRLSAIDNKEHLLDEIYEERFKELVFEGHRWFDLRRTTKPALVKYFDNQPYVLDKNDSRYIIPIPEEARNNNSNL